MGIAGCNKTPEIPDGPDDQTPVDKVDPEPTEPVTLTAYISEAGPDAVPATRATLNESTGAFAFSEGDAIKVYNGSGTYASTGVTIEGSSARFTMEEGFTDAGSGLAAFPSEVVSAISTDGVTFQLPDIYEYSQVGSAIVSSTGDVAAAASAAKVPCPMIASYAAGQHLYFKQAGAVVRFRITNCLAGSLTFTFTTPVTGTVTVPSVPTGTSDGIHNTASGLTGYSITVTGVPAVGDGNYLFITLPVPSGTDPMNVGVWNNGTLPSVTEAANRVATLSGTADPLNRTQGHKRGVSLESVWTAATFDGLWLDGYLHDLGDSFEIVNDPLEILKYYGNSASIDSYYFKWNTLNYYKFCTTGYDFNDGYIYRVPSGGENGEWARIVGTSRSAAKVKGSNAHYAFVTVTGLDSSTYNTSTIGGLILFPDNAIISVPSGADLSAFNQVSRANTLSKTALYSLLDQGCTFFPTAGCYDNSVHWSDLNQSGFYWASTAETSATAYALAIVYKHPSYQDTIRPLSESTDNKTTYFPVHLLRIPKNN